MSKIGFNNSPRRNHLFNITFVELFVLSNKIFCDLIFTIKEFSSTTPLPHRCHFNFLKSMSERDGSDIERLWISMTTRRIQSILSRSRNSSFYFRVVVCRIRLFPTLISKINWLWSELPLIFVRTCICSS